MAKIPKRVKDKMATLVAGGVFERETIKKVKVGNPARKIEFEIGDSKEDDFKPQYKTLHWDNEANFSARLVTKDGAVTEHDGKMAYDDGEKIARFYEKDTGDEDGGFEFDVVLNSKPDSNVLTWTIRHKDLDFFYQPALTAEEIKEGTSRPENVEGSYAVYHKTKKNNRVGGKEYRTGKAFHIYRPYAEDANGERVWCELNITDDLMTVTVPQEWVDKAVYPVVVDPAFGYTSVGGSNTNTANFVGNQHASSETTTIQKLSMYGRSTNSEITGGGGLYEGTSFIAETIGRKNLPTTGDNEWHDFSFSSHPSVVSSTNYIIGFQTDTPGAFGGFRYSLDTSGGTGRLFTTEYPTWPDPASYFTNSNKYSIYATYTEASSARRRILIIS